MVTEPVLLMERIYVWNTYAELAVYNIEANSWSYIAPI